jgi:hypothetical protein
MTNVKSFVTSTFIEFIRLLPRFIGCASVRDVVTVAAVREDLYPLGDGSFNRGQLQLAEMRLAHISGRYGLQGAFNLG